ncbi:hypothetical protein KKI19_03345 [Patescibacteria group bacterium]|nr:hypothetical protein [Patescibacteria group bacterium]
MKKLLPTSVFFFLLVSCSFSPSLSLAQNQTSTVTARLAYEGQFINCEEEAYLIRCLTPECDDYSEIYWDEPHGNEQGYYYFVFYNIPYGEYAVHIKGCDHAKGKTLLTTGETRIIVDQPDELEDVVVVETEPCSCEPSPPPVGPPDLPPDYFPSGSLQCRPDLIGDRDSRPYRNLDCDLCNITGLFCPSCATSSTVFDTVSWEWRDKDVECEGNVWVTRKWPEPPPGTIVINPSDTKIPFVGKKREEITGRVDKVHEDEKLYLADYFEGTHEYYRRYPLAISFPIIGDVDLLHGVNSNLRINYQGVFRKLAPMVYQDKLKEQMIERAQATQAENIHEGGVHNYELNYVRRICWHAPFWLDVLALIADKIVEHAKVSFNLDPLAITHYCLYGYNTTTDHNLIRAVKGILDEWNSSTLVSLFPFLKIPYFYQLELAQQMLTLEGNYPPDPSEEDYAEKWKDWKFKDLEEKEFSDAGKLWEVVPMFSREDTPGMIIPYLGSKPLDTFEITNPENQVEKVPHVARLYESTQEVQKMLVPFYKEDLQFSQNKSEPIIASPAEEKAQEEKILLAQGPSAGCIPAGCKVLYPTPDCSCLADNSCMGEHSQIGYCGYHMWGGCICGYTDCSPVPPGEVCCLPFCSGVGPPVPPGPTCGLPDALAVNQCEMEAITDTNENDDLCCNPINIEMTAVDMFINENYTECSDYTCGPTGTSLCPDDPCLNKETREVNREIGITLLHPYLTDIWEQTGLAETAGLFNIFRPAKITEFREIDASSEIVYTQSGFDSIAPSIGKFYFNYLGGVQLAKEWVTRALMPWKE